MKTKVSFSTIFGRVEIEADMDFSVSDEFLNGDPEAWREGVLARLAIPKADKRSWYEGHQHYNLWFKLAVVHDFELIRKQNEEYLAKEDNGRHHVDLKSIEVREIWIDGKFFRIQYVFTDCYGTKRLFGGAQYTIQNGYRDDKDAFHVAMPIELQVYF